MYLETLNYESKKATQSTVTLQQIIFTTLEMGWLVHKIMSLFQRLLHWCTDDYALSLRANITVQRDSSMANKSTDKSP